MVRSFDRGWSIIYVGGHWQYEDGGHYLTGPVPAAARPL
jgi:hypothetical protein